MVRFTRKKIDSLTLGERMQKLRSQRRLSISDISKGTKIQSKYLEYLEIGEYTKLPADVYVKGFLRSYAIYMGLNEISLIKQFEREKGIHKNIKKISDDENVSKPLKFSSVVITPRMIVVSGTILFSLACFFYLYHQVNSFVSTPRLVLLKPTDGTSVDGSSVHVSGIAEKDALVFINDQPVLVNENGEFSEDVGLKDGINNITIKARNKFDKEAMQAITVNAHMQAPVSPEPNQAAGEQAGNDAQTQDKQQDAPIVAEVYVNPNSTWLSVEADGNLVYSGVLLPESTQTFQAKNVISVTSGKGNETYIKINGKDLGTISNDSGVVRDIHYNAGGKIKDKK